MARMSKITCRHEAGHAVAALMVSEHVNALHAQGGGSAQPLDSWGRPVPKSTLGRADLSILSLIHI